MPAPSNFTTCTVAANTYLLALAVGHGGRLMSFDQRIALSALRGAGAEHLLVL